MVDRGRSPIRAASSPASQRGGEPDPRQSGRLRAGDTSEFTRSELNALLAQEAQEEEAELGSSTVRLEADQLDSVLEKARQKLPPPRAQQATQPYDQVTAFVLLEKDHDDTTPTTPAAEPAVEEEPVIDVDEGEPIESVAPPAPAAVAPEEPPPIASSPLPLVPAAPATPVSLPSAALDQPDARARRLRVWTLVAMAGALALAALLYFALVEAAPATSPAPPGEPASGETRPVGPAR